jgi:hypothetical protein
MDKGGCCGAAEVVVEAALPRSFSTSIYRSISLTNGHILMPLTSTAVASGNNSSI